jgi:AraC-like DNA-binding protein
LDSFLKTNSPTSSYQAFMKEFLLIGGGQGVVMAIFLLLVKNPINTQSNRLLSLLIFLVSIFLLVSSQNNYFPEYPKFFLASYFLIYLYCPVYYFYIKSLVNPHWSFKLKEVIYFLPAIAFGVMLIRYFLMTNAEILHNFDQLNFYDLLLMDTISIGINLYLIFLSYNTLKDNKDELPVKAAGQVYNIIHVILAASNVIWFIYVINQVSFIVWGQFVLFSFDLNYIIMSSFIILFAYLLVAKNYYFVKDNKIASTPYKNVSYEHADLEALAENIKEILKKDRSFLNPAFSLSMLAKAASSDKFKVSYTLNNVMNTTFTMMAGKYRVEAFIDMVESGDYKTYSMEGISQEAGFNTKSTFYKAFRENKGTTPKEYFSELQHSKLIEVQMA